MIHACESDMVAFLKNLVQALQPYAQANQICLCFASNATELKVVHEPFTLLQSVSQRILQIINLIPYQSRIEVRLNSLPQSGTLAIEIENNGINLIPISYMFEQGAYPFCGHALANGTVFRLTLHLNHQMVEASQSQHTTTGNNQLPQFYAELRKRLRWHFTQPEKLVATLSASRPLEASFLQKVNALIKANLHDEYFDTCALCKAMAMSRTQLFRRLKPLIRQAPAHYIKTMRLQKAKEMLETMELTVSEVAFRCGFTTRSNFTKGFQRQYGLLPSLFQRSRHATNE